MAIRVAVIGTGRRGQSHLRRLMAHPAVELAAVCDVNQMAADAAAHATGARPYTRFETLFEEQCLDAVVVATPPQFHALPALEAAARGVHLFLEKPVAFDLPDALRIAAAVEQAKILCTVGYQWRHQPGSRRARELLEGQPVALVRIHWYHTIPLVPSLRDKRHSGGQIVEQVTHLVDLARYLVGEVDEAYARYTLATRTEQEFPNWDGYGAVLRFAHGAVGTISSTYALWQGQPDKPTTDIIGRELLVRLAGQTLTAYRPRQPPEEVQGEGDVLGAFLDAVVHEHGQGTRKRVSRVKGQGQLLSPIRDAVRSHAVCLACNESAETGRPVKLADFLRREGRREQPRRRLRMPSIAL